MVKFLLSTAAYLIANAVGLLVAVIILPGFKIGISAFVLAVLIFSILQTVAGPLLTKLSLKQFPQLTGGIALVTILFGLIVTDLLMSQMEVGGISNLLAASLLVWIGSLVASILIPIYVFKQLREGSERRLDDLQAEAERATAAAERAAKSAAAAQSSTAHNKDTSK